MHIYLNRVASELAETDSQEHFKAAEVVGFSRAARSWVRYRPGFTYSFMNTYLLAQDAVCSVVGSGSANRRSRGGECCDLSKILYTDFREGLLSATR